MKSILVRCFVRPKGNKYIGICITLNLAVQADSSKEAVEKLMDQIGLYLESVAERNIKIKRRSPLRFYTWYFAIKILFTIARFKSDLVEGYKRMKFNVTPASYKLA